MIEQLPSAAWRRQCRAIADVRPVLQAHQFGLIELLDLLHVVPELIGKRLRGLCMDNFFVRGLVR
jgi:hypothetical protein